MGKSTCFNVNGAITNAWIAHLGGLQGDLSREARGGFEPRGHLNMWITSSESCAASRTQTSESQTNTSGRKAVFTSSENGNGKDDIDTNRDTHTYFNIVSY